MKKYFTVTVIFCCLFLLCSKQSIGESPVISKGFQGYYPISDNPSIQWLSPYKWDPFILFDAKPSVYYNFYNNFIEKLNKSGSDALNGSTVYLNFKPQLRMYNSVSKPVNMPSYRIFAGSQVMYRLGGIETSIDNLYRKTRFIAVSLETGHYSNGQDRCAFSSDFEDESVDCKDIYNSIDPSTNLSELLNRSSGNFSTNLTELIVSLRFNKHLKEGDDGIPFRSNRFYLGANIYHNWLFFFAPVNIGGYTEDDIKLYGKWRLLFRYNRMGVFNNSRSYYEFNGKVTYIPYVHEFVNPLRIEGSGSIFPWTNKDIGFIISYSYGHDDYNFRLVDSGHRVGIGITWNMFPLTAKYSVVRIDD